MVTVNTLCLKHILIEVKIIGKNARRFDRTSVIIKLKSEDKILHAYKYKTKK